MTSIEELEALTIEGFQSQSGCPWHQSGPSIYLSIYLSVYLSIYTYIYIYTHTCICFGAKVYISWVHGPLKAAPAPQHGAALGMLGWASGDEFLADTTTIQTLTPKP